MFLHLSVSHSVHGGISVRETSPGQRPPRQKRPHPRQRPPLDRDPPDRDPLDRNPLDRDTPRTVTSEQCATYWNVFLSLFSCIDITCYPLFEHLLYICYHRTHCLVPILKLSAVVDVSSERAFRP